MRLRSRSIRSWEALRRFLRMWSYRNSNMVRTTKRRTSTMCPVFERGSWVPLPPTPTPLPHRAIRTSVRLKRRGRILPLRSISTIRSSSSTPPQFSFPRQPQRTTGKSIHHHPRPASHQMRCSYRLPLASINRTHSKQTSQHGSSTNTSIHRSYSINQTGQLVPRRVSVFAPDPLLLVVVRSPRRVPKIRDVLEPAILV
ncbi:hypothetical protein PHSY_003249 [Pseudozyma hubeiensis SY62]|uniref:Uncharacterized protein n=1 Tax=Pseudozyma hubeiensis (strain SY62) TaxID=1305764 RepID=R9P2N5_PSEHS|nr:hypothetical protein PHSY_003249 [Pseudozyma hubeiensis SY62]GAC95673.1 hypothetical protein PHSY_003249 [Pseudozyma hubeiensis SY62]